MMSVLFKDKVIHLLSLIIYDHALMGDWTAKLPTSKGRVYSNGLIWPSCLYLHSTVALGPYGALTFDGYFASYILRSILTLTQRYIVLFGREIISFD